MTSFEKRVRRVTLGSYRITVSGADRWPTGRRLVVELYGDNNGDYVSIREAGRRHRVVLDVAGLYRRGLLATTKKRKATQ